MVPAAQIAMHSVSSAHPEVVDFGFWQGRSRRAPTGVARLRRGPTGSESAARGQKMPFMDGHYLSENFGTIR